jgi:pimeloyl-ACP methyl ester carboxylesterase
MEQFINQNQKKISFEDKGKGNPIVLLHGFLESLEIWNQYVKELSREFRVVTIDLPGHGKTEAISEVHTMELMADVVKSVLDNLKITECVIIGHSMGGYVALAFAEKYGSFVKGLGLFHSSALADTNESLVNRDRMIALVKQDKLGFISQFISSLFAKANQKRLIHDIGRLEDIASSMKPESVIAALEGMKVRTDKIDLLRTAEFRIMYVAGQEDTRIPLEVILAQVKLIPHYEINFLGGVGHMGFLEAREETLDQWLNFARKCYGNLKTED